MVIAFFLSSPCDFDVVRNCGCCAGWAGGGGGWDTGAAAAAAVPAGPASISSVIASRLSGPTARALPSKSSSKTCHFWRLGQYLPRVPLAPFSSGCANLTS